jgi:hypothetical protein
MLQRKRTLALLGLLPLLAAPLAVEPFATAGTFESAYTTIKEKEIEGHVETLAQPIFEGRDSPSAGLTAAADYIIEHLMAAGCLPPSALAGPTTPEAGAAATPPDPADYRVPFTRTLPAPVPEDCRLSFRTDEGEPVTLALGTDFVPLVGCEGQGRGAPVFVGFGISASSERYDDLRGGSIKGKVAVIVEGEPRHRRAFDGPDVTDHADVHTKVSTLEKKGAVGVLIVRRVPETWKKKPSAAEKEALPPLGFRHTWAQWNPSTTKRLKRSGGNRSFRIPVHEITPEAAQRILGEDVLALARKADKSLKGTRREPKGVEVELAAEIEQRPLNIDNVVAVVPGVDPELAHEVVIIGAHYDHIGVDQAGRIAYGADDNGSGTAAVIEMAEAFASSPARRSVMLAAFAAEEDGLLGSKALANDLPVPRENVVAMINLDMVGCGDPSLVVVLGTQQNPDLARVLKRAKKLKNTRIKSVVTGKAQHLWQRSDHYSFHEVGIPTLFFFEAVSEAENGDYHTFRDTPDICSYDKIARTTRLAFNTAWLIANDDDRPSPPRD